MLNRFRQPKEKQVIRKPSAVTVGVSATTMSRFTRLTNEFSKKLENHEHALALYFRYYKFCRILS
jgi:hypothetical protein